MPVMFGNRASDIDGSTSAKIGCVQSAAGRTFCRTEECPYSRLRLGRPGTHLGGPEPSCKLTRDEIDPFALWITSHNAQSRLTPWQDRFQAPVVESQVQPQYPANLKSFLIESARVEVVIDQQGVPFSVKSATSLPDNVVQALAKWRFRPARGNGAPVGYRVGILVPIHREIGEMIGA